VNILASLEQDSSRGPWAPKPLGARTLRVPVWGANNAYSNMLNGCHCR